jgi:hypothetical protein
MSVSPTILALASPMRALLVVIVLSLAWPGHLDHAVMAASAAMPSASNSPQTPKMPCEGGRCTYVRHCHIVAPQLAATLSGQQRDLEAPADAIVCLAPTAASRSVPYPATAGAPVPNARLYLTTARLRL